MSDLIMHGDVWLVGAGPGDPDLLTRKAEKLILAADIIFYDALVGQAVLDLIPSATQRVSVGKRSGRHSRDQASINALLVDAAKMGQRVVRLKGGDPSIFGRATEEIEHLAKNGVRVQICPGITAASAAAASAGVSLTLRGMARKLTFVTAHPRAGEILDIDWKALADSNATLAIYMGKTASRAISNQLIAAGLTRDTPAIIVENASLPNERIVRTRLDLLEIATAPVLTDGPAILLIGAAMQTRTQSAPNFKSLQTIIAKS
jgi:uroporphyrin-III C-methyltransferase